MMFAEPACQPELSTLQQDAAALRRAEISYWNYWTSSRAWCGLASHPEIILLTLLGKVDYGAQEDIMIYLFILAGLFVFFAHQTHQPIHIN